MGKRGGFPGGMGGFGGMNLNNLMKEAKKMQADMEKTQSELATKEFEASAGGNAVVAKVNGAKKLLSVKINPDVCDKDDVEMLEDLVLTAVNEALNSADAAMQSEMGSFNIPGLF